MEWPRREAGKRRVWVATPGGGQEAGKGSHNGGGQEVGKGSHTGRWARGGFGRQEVGKGSHTRRRASITAVSLTCLFEPLRKKTQVQEKKSGGQLQKDLCGN